ncbi:glycosyltransferase family 4 protein [Pontibacter sp. KCTC 32443]|uniref:glycosyltransferase family 4 protein n=1 Tax=Pontibacter TaxID=323449 RepID=UPI00164D31DD|nr:MULTISPECIES: glycosyltransferase family 4 protein [Pontibacter]MBC5773494.1 glycosyltransferase family 4 protein [Pontibacter sp. KCTC 32443]
MSKIRILWLAHEASISGANICLLEHFQILVQNGGFEIYLIVPKVGSLNKRAGLLGIPSFVVPYYSWTVPLKINQKTSFKSQVKRKIRNIIAFGQLGKLIAEIKPDFVTTNTITINIGALVAKSAKIKHVWFVHEFGEEDHGFSLPGGMAKAKMWIGDMSDKVAVNSLSMAKFYKNSIPEEKLKLVYNPVLTMGGLRPRREADKLHLVMLGQISPAKNQLDAIKAVILSRELGLNCSLTIAGPIVSSAYKEILDNYIALYNATDHIKFMGPIQDVCSFFLNADALLMCSRMEAFGRVTVEAFKMGVPVIASDSGASTELVEEGVNGFLYLSGNINSLTQTIIRFKGEADNFNSLNIAEKAHSTFNASVVEKQLLEVFK